MDKKELMELDLEIIGIKHKLNKIKYYKSNDSFKDKYNKLYKLYKTKLLIQKEFDPYRYQINRPQLEKNREERYNNLPLKIKSIIQKYNYDYLKDNSGIFTPNPDPSCPIAKEVTNAREEIEQMNIYDFYRQREWNE
ncbi:hypothetical protein [Arcobacter arenosus]|uniref:Uncharacterized protein n=1 Tax=Arcobacter arenosus TaxID=2576037 RepID=A0A5R8XYV0_9BACT|nr:hypothetical protein [Arcobacter arenosus]TLP36952.1 hypothetical protein FDK22_11960 [Arcobacter arenosus]